METTVLLAVTVNAPDHLSNEEINDAIVSRAADVQVTDSKPLSLRPGVYISCLHCGTLRATRKATRANRRPIGECCA